MTRIWVESLNMHDIPLDRPDTAALFRGWIESQIKWEELLARVPKKGRSHIVVSHETYTRAPKVPLEQLLGYTFEEVTKRMERDLPPVALIR